MTSLTKNPHLPSKKIFFECRLEDLSFETFTGSVEHTGPEKFPRKATCVWAFFSENPRILADAKELIVVQVTECFETLFLCL